MSERRDWIERTLREALQADSVEVDDESHRHRGHPGAASGGGHFRVCVVSERFRDLPRVKRHRIVYDALADGMGDAIHALAIRALTPEEAAEGV